MEEGGHCQVTGCSRPDINVTVFDINVFNSYRYRDNMKKMSAISKDEPESPLNRAVWWAEYVLRHNGAKHLRSSALDLAWYQHLLLDVAAFLFLLLAITALTLYLILRIIYRYLTVHSYKVKSKHD
jgi:glucuronosyltransferase